MTQIVLSDFPKLHCPFIRKEFAVEHTSWKKYGKALGLRKPVAYLVVNQVKPGYEWVFDDPDTFCCEKLDGQNVKVKTVDNLIVAVQNRKNIIHFNQVSKKDHRVQEGLVTSILKGYIQPDGEQAGELLGPKLQGNPYQLDSHLWYPFDKAMKTLRYKSFDDHDRTLENWSIWLELYIFSLFMQRTGKKGYWPEGIVFYNERRKAQGKTHMAKLRRNMFYWFYNKVELIDYEKDF